MPVKVKLRKQLSKPYTVVARLQRGYWYCQ